MVFFACFFRCQSVADHVLLHGANIQNFAETVRPLSVSRLVSRNAAVGVARCTENLQVRTKVAVH
jgi:hypothetical protein